MYWLNDMYCSRYSGSIILLVYHHILIQHTQPHLTQSKSTSMFYFNFPRAFCTDQYIQVCTKYVQVHTHQEAVHTSFQSGMISLTSLLQGSIMGIIKFLYAVRIWWNNQYSILRKSSTTVLRYHSWYALVHTQYRPSMYEFVHSTY